MKKNNAFITFPQLAAAVVAAGISVTSPAQTWVNVNPPVTGVCGDLGIDDDGKVYAVGRQIALDGSSIAIVQRSDDQGANWITLDQFAEAGRSYAHNRAFAQDPISGNLLAGGNLNNLLANGNYQFDTLWFIREQDTGVWNTADDYSILADDVGQASCADIMVSPSGDVYATGGGQLGTGLGWIIRKRPAGASAFTTVDADYSGRTSGTGWDLAFHSTYGVFAVGDMNGLWTVRRSINGNKGTWVTTDSFYTPREWTAGSAKCILSTPAKIHVVGSAYNASTRKTHWVTRSSSDGQTWSITDNYAASGAAEGRGIVQDASGNFIVCGSVAGAAGGYQWVVRKGVPTTTQVKHGKQTVQVETVAWTTIDTYQLVAGKSALPNGIIIDSHGNTFVGGSAMNAAGVNCWIVRKLAP